MIEVLPLAPLDGLSRFVDFDVLLGDRHGARADVWAVLAHRDGHLAAFRHADLNAKKMLSALPTPSDTTALHPPRISCSHHDRRTATVRRPSTSDISCRDRSTNR